MQNTQGMTSDMHEKNLIIVFFNFVFVQKSCNIEVEKYTFFSYF